MKGSVSLQILFAGVLMLAPAFAQNAEEPLDEPTQDYTLSVLAYNSMI